MASPSPDRASPWRSRVAVGALALAPLVYFWRGTLGEVVLAPGDGTIYSLPVRALAMRMLREGEWPLWNPFVFGGFPLFGEMQTGVLYPGNWLLLALPPIAGINWQMLSLYPIAGIGTYAFARALGCTRMAAVFGGLTFSLGGFLVAHLGHVATPQGAAYLPWFLWSLERLRVRAQFRWVLAAALALALALCAGHPPIPMYLLVGGGLYVGWFGIAGRPPIGRIRYAALALVAVATALGLTAVQLWPAAELAAQSHRAALSYVEFVSYSLPPRQLPLLLFPYFFGGTPALPYWGAWNLPELTGYVGVAPLMLAAAVGFGAARRNPQAAFWLVLAAIALLLALGDATPLAWVTYRVPGYNLFRAQARNLLLFDFAIAVLSALALTTARPRALVAGVVLVAIGAATFAVIAIVAGVRVFAPVAALAARSGGPEHVMAAIAPRNPALWMPLVWTAAAAIAVLAVARRPSPLPIAVLLTVHALDLFYFVSLSEPTPSAATALLEPPSVIAARQALPDSAVRVVLMGDGPLVTDYRWVLWGTRLVNGYDPFMLTRYGDFADGMSYWGQLSAVVVAQRPWFLDLLAAGVAVVSKTERDAAGYGVNLAPGEALEFVPAAPQRATAVAARTALTQSAELTDGTAVARVTVWDAGGEPTELMLRAGDHTAQWEWDAAGGAARIRHRRAPMAEVDGSSGPFYSATIPLPHPVEVARLRLEYLQPAGALAVDGMALGDAAAGSIVPLGGLDALRANPQRWVPRVDTPTFAVFENRRALPRAWLVGQTVAAAPSEQLWTVRSGRLPDRRPFDPQTVALVDEGGHDRGPLRDADAQIVGESPTRIELITHSATPAFLVLSEVFYPGWSAAVDGAPVPLVRTDYALRGLEVPAGVHRVTCVYRPASVAAGAAVSAATVALVLVTAVWQRRRRRRASAVDQFA